MSTIINGASRANTLVRAGVMAVTFAIIGSFGAAASLADNIEYVPPQPVDLTQDVQAG